MLVQLGQHSDQHLIFGTVSPSIGRYGDVTFIIALSGPSERHIH